MSASFTARRSWREGEANPNPNPNPNPRLTLTLTLTSYDVIASPRSGVSGRWAEVEMEAAARRYEAPVPESLTSS